jgi:coenzyme F420-reducing hydrogenase beta subunit/Na+-translocating ferredoxin:NAD+ oxidoreductase RnfD subunit
MGIKTSVIAPMTKDLLMKYTFVALFFIAFMSFFVFGLESLLVTIISVGVAVGLDFLLSMVMGSRGPRNLTSAAVFGMIVAMSYSLGLPELMALPESLNIPTLAGGIETYLYAALISAVGLIVFKKLAGLAGRKYVNPAAIAKLIVVGLLVLPALTALLPADHANSINLQNPLTPSGFEGFPDYYPMETTTFGSTLLTCYSGSPTNPYVYGTFENPLPDVLFTMLFAKYHGWVGGFSSIIVIIVGILLFAAARRYIKWRITAAYLVTTAVFAVVLGLPFVYGGDIVLRVLFHLFMGSSIFMAFFMATDPATTPITRRGQVIFGIGLAILTMIIQTYMGFLGGSILALVVMNLTTPLLDRVGIPKSAERRDEPKINTQYFDSARVYDCMRCSACMYVCCNSLSPIVIKQAADKHNVKKMMILDADYCKSCGDCNLVCPVRIDLRSYMLDYPLKGDEAREIEQQFLKGKADEDLGVYSDMFSAKSEIEGQDGGVATALLVSGMQKGLFDSAVVVQKTDGYWAEAVAAENIDDLMKAKGTKYLRIPLMSTLRDLIMKGKRKIAIVGMACDVRSVRRVQQVLLHEYPDLELSVIGLFCYECFDYEKLRAETMKLLNVDLDQAEKTQISKGKYIVTVDRKEHSVPVKELNDAVEKMCLICPDFTAQYADISVGSVGSDDGYSTVIVRSDVGKKLWEKLDLAKGKVKKEDLTKLSVNKKKRAKKNSMDLQ